MAYATPAELAAALRVAVTAASEPVLQACLDAAATEIDHAIDGPLLVPVDALVNRVNVLRGVEWYKANDAAGGSAGFESIGSLDFPRSSFAAHAAVLTPLKVGFGVG